MNVLLLGDLILDKYIFGDVSRISPEAPIPILDHIKEEFVLGGALNVARNLNNLDNHVYSVGILGKDDAANSVSDIMNEENLSTDFIVYDNQSITSKKTRFIASNQQLLRLDVESNTYSKKNESQLIKIVASLIRKVDFVLISDYKKGVCSNDLLDIVLSKAKSQTINTFIDPKGSDFTKYKDAYCITPNILETKAVYKNDLITNKNFEEACKFICDTFSIKTCIITRGKDGMTVYDSKKFCHIKSKAKDVFDVSGAGDTVISTLATYHSRGKNLIDAAKIANLAAQHVVGEFGTTPIEQTELNKYI